MKIHMKVFGSTVGLGLLVVMASAGSAHAVTIVGNAGTLGSDGVVTGAPGHSIYRYVTTSGGVSGGGQIVGIPGGTNGSSWQSDPFAANVGDDLSFYFNYVTSEGGLGFDDYSWAALLDSSLNTVGYLVTAHTFPVGGYSLPPNISTLTPAAFGIIDGIPVWSPLGSSSGFCGGIGCGYTGWIKSEFTITTAGNYSLIFGVTNTGDFQSDSGLAFAGAEIGGKPISPVPLPAALPLLATGVAGLAALRRRKSRKA
jgi:hypothetical protein